MGLESVDAQGRLPAMAQALLTIVSDYNKQRCP